MALGGGVSAVAWLADRIVPWAIATAVIGVFTLINGLMAEDGVW